jgi:hypothetical protein
MSFPRPAVASPRRVPTAHQAGLFGPAQCTAWTTPSTMLQALFLKVLTPDAVAEFGGGGRGVASARDRWSRAEAELNVLGLAGVEHEVAEAAQLQWWFPGGVGSSRGRAAPPRGLPGAHVADDPTDDDLLGLGLGLGLDGARLS